MTLSKTERSLCGDAVHNIFTHLTRKPLGFDEPFENRIAELEATTSGWNHIPTEYRERIRTHWRFLAYLYEEAHSIFLEEEGENGQKPDITRCLKKGSKRLWQVIEIKVSTSEDTSDKTRKAKSRKQVHDVMKILRAKLPSEETIEGYWITLPLDLEESSEPRWEKIPFTPAS